MPLRDASQGSALPPDTLPEALPRGSGQEALAAVFSGSAEGLPRYRVAELNAAIATLLDRGFAPRFLLEASVGRPQLKKGHLWLSLSDGEATITGVVWASQLRRLSYVPEDGDGVVVVGRLSFWSARATLAVQVLDVRPALSTVLRQFERVRAILEPEGLLDPARKRALPAFPGRIALLTSVPSSALADMLRTARERWPGTALLVVPIPVQGPVERSIVAAVQALAERHRELGLEALVLARGGGSREDLSVFDGEALARALAACPIPVVCGLGHEDDTTIADLVADFRAATPTAAIVALLPDQRAVRQTLAQSRNHLQQQVRLRLRGLRDSVNRQRQALAGLHPRQQLTLQRTWLQQQRRLLEALSPQHQLRRGFALVRGGDGRLIRSIEALHAGDGLQVSLSDGTFQARVERLSAKQGRARS
ncbi:MAG: exodeoxyribonuclease VII large subunit [Cyanobacteriota bacterium]|nr:exodeoxyribonuclease VII large subunit [Cyanobacteriota bacterium]